MNAIQRAQSAASMAATRLHRELGTTFDGPVDVLSVARDLGVVLMMQPLDALLGFYVRGSTNAGIVINSQLPESLQRFTLAHEIGHHVLGHEGTADDEHAVDRFDSTSVTEAAAQSFASSLIMPAPLVMKALRDLPAVRAGERPTSSDAYLFSRQLGVSFAAGVWTLYGKNRIDLATARGFVRAGALSAKDALRGGSAVTDARADVWILTKANNDLDVMCRVGDEIRVQLPELPSSGREWRLRSGVLGQVEPDTESQLDWDGEDTITPSSLGAERSKLPVEGGVDLLSDDFFNDTDIVEDQSASPAVDPRQVNFPASLGTRELILTPTEAGGATLELELVNAWDPNAEGLEHYTLDLHVRPRQLGEAGLLAPERDRWVAEHSVAQ